MFKLVISNSFQKMGWLAEVTDNKSNLLALQEKHRGIALEHHATAYGNLAESTMLRLSKLFQYSHANRSMPLKSKTLGQYARQLDDTPWLTVLSYAWGVFSLIAVMSLFAPAAWRPTIKVMLRGLPLLFIVAKDLAQLPRVLILLQDLRRQPAGLHRYLTACLPPALIGFARLDRALWGGFFRWMRRQPNLARPTGLKLTFLERGAYTTVVAWAFFSVLIELPIAAAVLPLLVRDSTAVHAIHVVSILGAAYSLVWLLGDRWMVRGGYHVLTDSHLDLQIGARARANIPLAAIENMSLLRESMDEWRSKHSLRHAETVNITPFDKPNVVLRLSPKANCVITHHGLVRNDTRYVFLYLDQPGQLISAFATRPK